VRQTAAVVEFADRLFCLLRTCEAAGVFRLAREKNTPLHEEAQPGFIQAIMAGRYRAVLRFGRAIVAPGRLAHLNDGITSRPEWTRRRVSDKPARSFAPARRVVLAIDIVPLDGQYSQAENRSLHPAR
jgi:hypothetical protein